MVGRHSQRPSWRLVWALFATVTNAVNITATNSSTGIDYEGTINLQGTNGNNITTLVPLTSDATERDLNGELFYTTDANPGNITQQDIAYISCDLSDYAGNIHPDAVLKTVYDTNRAQAAILYSTESNYCNYTATDASLGQFPVYSTTNMGDAQKLRDNLAGQGPGFEFFTKITRSGDADANNGSGQGSGQQGQQNPLGPSPSTAVAMIILYSITGVITALFLVIIVTGAVRAHRHPDRYGPRDVMGRPRQSRARGLGMAILDTIPIVKFGEREQPKPTDVELGSTAEARDVNTAHTDTTTPATTETRTDPTTDTNTPQDNTISADQQIAGLDSGIAPAQPVAGASVTQTNDSADEGLGCSICTDDFEKGQDIRVLPCNHKFHPECVDPWLLNVSGTCPLCRVDLRPTTSHTSTDSQSDPDALAPPLQSEAEPSNRRHSTLRDVLSFRSRPNASANERISALRRLREHRRNQSGEAVAGASSEDVTAGARDRRSKRMSVRLSDVFSGRRRGESIREEREETSATGEASSSQPPPTRDESPGGDDTTAGAQNPNPRT